ncbi:MAG: FKBP-type peptidyl-prolyl cis-trans isomerase [Patescibacteria group bacterium]
MGKSQILSIIGFIVIALSLLWAGSRYSGKISSDSLETQKKLADEAAQAESKIMENLKITDIIKGNGAEAKSGDVVTVNYVGALDNGKKFDSSYDRNEPLSFTLGSGEVIRGWDLGVVGMKVGGKRELSIPPELGYGANGAPPVIPPNSTLHFTVELLKIGSN